jgi:hypothetical protein
MKEKEIELIKIKVELIKHDGYEISVASLIEEDIPFLLTIIKSLEKENKYLDQRMLDNHSIAMKHIIKLDEQADIIESQKEEIEKLERILVQKNNEESNLWV